MANIASALKNIRSSETKRQRNRYQHKSTKTLLKKIYQENQYTPELQTKVQEAYGMLDKLAKRNIIHVNKSARKKSQLARYVNTLKK